MSDVYNHPHILYRILKYKIRNNTITDGTWFLATYPQYSDSIFHIVSMESKKRYYSHVTTITAYCQLTCEQWIDGNKQLPFVSFNLPDQESRLIVIDDEDEIALYTLMTIGK